MATTKIEAIKSITREDGVTISLDSIVEVDLYKAEQKSTSSIAGTKPKGKKYEGVVTRLITGIDVTEAGVITNTNKGYAWVTEIDTSNTSFIDITHISNTRSANRIESAMLDKLLIPSTILPHGGGTYWKVPLALRTNGQNTPLYVVEGGTYGVLHNDSLEHTNMSFQFRGQVTKVSSDGVYMQGRFLDDPDGVSIIHCDVRLIRPVLLYAQFSYERDSLYSSINKTQEGE